MRFLTALSVYNILKKTVRTKGLEPPRLSAPDPKSGAATITPRPRFEFAKILTFCQIRKFPGRKSDLNEVKPLRKL